MAAGADSTAAPERADTEIEEWRPVEGFEGCYEVSSLGRMRSLDRILAWRNGHGRLVRRRIQGVLLFLQRDRKGYPTIALQRDGKLIRRGVHQLVCRAFHGPPPSPDHLAAHNDGNPSNPRAVNLRWATSLENAFDQHLHGTRARGERHGMAKLAESEAVNILKDRRSGRAVAGDYGVSETMISRIRLGKAWSHLPGSRRLTGEQVTHCPGERNPNAKLTAKIVRKIRSASGTQDSIAARFGVSQAAVSLIRRRKLWAHLA